MLLTMSKPWCKDAGWGWVRCYEPREVPHGRMVLKVYRNANDNRTYVANIVCDLPGVYLPTNLTPIKFRFKTKREATAWGLKQYRTALRETKHQLATYGVIDLYCQYVELKPQP